MGGQGKGQRRFLVASVLLCLVICVVYNWKPKRQGHGYTFQKVESPEAYENAGSSWIYGPDRVDLETDAQFRGALLALFGRPLWESDDYEAAYEYLILAEAQDGRQYTLWVYQGPTGAAVGGDPEEEGIEEAAASLCELLMTSTPADYEAEMIYTDTHSTIRYGCQDGKPYAEETRQELWL